MLDIYKDIANRTNGDIYVGVVGPVRTGKSTFIAKLIDELVLPNIENNYDKDRTRDETPQSGDGKSIMTTQPHFVPNDAVAIDIGQKKMNIKMVDCVGYLVAGALGVNENDKQRMVDTPWSDEPMPFQEAAELGTKKVIDSHSTIAVMITTDGSITGINREDYEEAEEKVINELKQSNKPFVVVVNSTNPKSEDCKKIKTAIQNKYDVDVLAFDVKNMTSSDIDKLFGEILQQFPITGIDIKMPNWLQGLPDFHPVIEEIRQTLLNTFGDMQRLSDADHDLTMFENSENFEPINTKSLDMGEGRIIIVLEPKNDLFYKVLSDQCGVEIKDDYDLITYVKELTEAKIGYDKIKKALEEVTENGYGVVCPNLTDIKLEDPEVVKAGGRFGVKLKASAASLHIMQVDINTEVSPIMGTEQQSEEMVTYLMEEYKNNPDNFWQTKMFGKTLELMISEEISSKVYSMPKEIQKKMRRTMGRIVNEGKGGIICILL